MYLDKCFLCEKFVGAPGEVEHFHPWSLSHPARAYEWANLHWSCDSCNQRKRRAMFCCQPSGSVKTTQLLDPSAIPGGFLLKDLLNFTEDCCAMSLAASLPSPECDLAQNTALFLNDAEVRTMRLTRLTDMISAAAVHGFIPIWRTVCQERSIDPASWSPEKRSELMEPLDKADALYGTFLVESQPYAACLRAIVFGRIRISCDDFRRMSDAIRDYKSTPRLLP
jgi:hypothetical protein